MAGPTTRRTLLDCETPLGQNFHNVEQSIVGGYLQETCGYGAGMHRNNSNRLQSEYLLYIHVLVVTILLLFTTKS